MTQPLPLLHVPDLDQPGRWDRRLNLCNTPDELADELRPHRTDLHARRFLQATLATGNTPRLLEALNDLESRKARGLEGPHNRALVMLGRYAEVLSAPRAPGQSSDPLDLENVADDEMALATAWVELGEPDRALPHLHALTLLSRALGMLYRQQWSRIEAGRLGTLRGTPDSAALIDALQMLPMSRRREAWGLQSLAETQMAEGDYPSAWLTLRDAEPGDVDDLPLLLSAILDLPAPEGDDTQGEYAALATGVRTMQEARPVDLAALRLPTFEPARTYGELLRAAALTRNLRSRDQGVRLLRQRLGGVMTPDQRAIGTLTLASTLAEQGSAETPQALAAFSEALGALPVALPVLELFSRVAPDRLALVALAPGALPTLTPLLTALPVLTGSNLQQAHLAHKLPGRASGSVGLVRAGFEGRPVRLQDGAQQRVQAALTDLGVRRYVNLGVILRQLLQVGERVCPEQRPAWVQAFRHTLDLLDSRALRTDLERQPNVCAFLHSQGVEPGTLGP